MRKSGKNSTIIIAVNCNLDNGSDVGKAEQSVEDDLAIDSVDVQGDCFEEENDDKCIHDSESIKGHIRMSKLIYFDEHKNEHDVHHGGVELETDVAGAGMEYGTEDSLKNQADSHAIEQTKLLQ